MQIELENRNGEPVEGFELIYLNNIKIPEPKYIIYDDKWYRPLEDGPWGPWGPTLVYREG